MIAHGFTVPQMVELIRAGLASAHTERVVAGGQRCEVAYLKITEAGRISRHSETSAVSPLYPPKADMAARFMSTRPRSCT